MRAEATSAEAFVAFKKYISAILDLLGSSSEIVDKLRAQEILFFGPDEGTADFMDWASQVRLVVKEGKPVLFAVVLRRLRSVADFRFGRR